MTSAYMERSEIEGLADFNNQVNYNNWTFDLRYLFAKIIVEFGQTLESNKLYLSAKICPNMPRFFFGNPYKIKELFNNIINHSIYYAYEGGIEISVSSASSDDYENHRTIMKVLATSSKISANELGSIYEPSWQRNKATLYGDAPSLYISKCITKSMGGNIDVKSIAGWGTEYTAEILMEVGAEPLTN